ncbi:hypothetical protein [Spirosoma radiotolerans]|uniref:Uncharacterized protein n=1 Tax=Spirosoma radiotolerans TaxID=1379870 RepID=A0A0E3V5J6_9BACT|nr:hypothetical protein [Spirosoma radiotolerans]AKD54212.1 hypothetical protein SD10_04130 [Spirosoma radiotolerans]
MEKRNVCRTATILCALFALAISVRVDMITWQWQEDKPMGAALGMLSIIFASQWVHYQKRIDSTKAQSRFPDWLRRLLH